ncbi:hypothetical protein P0092_16040 [Ruminiclostridium papyrosolvens DSM 2782]|uniref:hypothetical protein n=1 Tax=Ruminiclostridium papyrosolvens TaxID=29362 RepID=UPI0001B26630|nr:hypothetical protein [Ruminiclostridium papyrosolvens]WES33261.1 hypothetical protein P0092_16040 [Ruminiclostridium papyrosolvens DSM 2782]
MEIKASDKIGTASGNPEFYTINLTGLTPNQKYTAYIVTEDASGNTSNILSITDINPYSNFVLIKLGTPSVTLSPNTSETGGLAYTITAANVAEDSNIKEYSLDIAAYSAPETPMLHE